MQTLEKCYAEFCILKDQCVRHLAPTDELRGSLKKLNDSGECLYFLRMFWEEENPKTFRRL